MDDRRRFARTKILKPAKIVLGRPGALLDCRVCDISIGGVGISLQQNAAIPDEFELTFDSARTLRSCRVAWRSGNKIGAMFLAQSIAA